ncbi:YqcC family protein [Halomonas borealis]|uniref:YqcC family protein n=1 Tax=Halomonas borealis TaxID=2508710 RepID=UPI0010A0A2FC|nr:YqcC family protein [Halomonas borealis]
MTVHDELGQALRELESTMKASDLWRMERPAPEAFDSTQPFCIDAMSLPQWLRFVFIARLDALVEARAPLPASCDVAPAVEAYLVQEGAKTSQRVMMSKSVERIDQLVTES